MIPYYNSDFGLGFELPYGQTEGTLYGLLEADEAKILFASDLHFVMINKRIMVEPHYAFKPAIMVIKDIISILRHIG